MNGITKSALLVGASLCLAGTHFAAAQTKAPANTPEFLFVQTAKNVAYKDGVLTLQDASPVTVFFSDRRERIVGNVRNDVFFQKWTEGGNSFKSDPPNAVLSIFNDKSPPTSAVLVLNNPRLEGNNLAYDVRTLKGDLSASGIEGTLFIDPRTPSAPNTDTRNRPCHSPDRNSRCCRMTLHSGTALDI